MGLIKKIKHKKRTFDNLVRPLAYDKWDCFIITLDILWCRFVMGVSINEYIKYNFQNLRHRYRKHFILQRHRDKYTNVNIMAFTKSKYLFYTYIPDLYQRELILAPFCGEDAFVQFLKKHQKLVVKPDRGSLGEGLEVVNYTDEQAAKDYFAGITAERPFICEEFIRQHPAMSQLNPASVNTIRVVSLLQGGEVEIVSATLKTGFGDDNITDNLSMGGVGAQVDVKTGVVCTFGKDFHFHTYTHHPYSGAQIIGLQIPHWDQAVALIKEGHKRLPQCMIYGWDIAITETGVDVVEANSRPGSRIMQVMDGIPKGQKILPLIKKDRLKGVRKEYQDKFFDDFKSIAMGE